MFDNTVYDRLKVCGSVIQWKPGTILSPQKQMFSINWKIWRFFRSWKMGTTGVFAASAILASPPSAFPQVSKIGICSSAHSDEILFCTSFEARGWERCASFSSPNASLCPSWLCRAWARCLPMVWENTINAVHFSPWGFHLLHCTPGCYRNRASL